MANMIGKISGGMLNDNLVREGVDLSFETDLLYLDVNTRRIGIRNDSPIRDFIIDTYTSTVNLHVDNNILGPNISIASNGFTSTYGPINLVTPSDNSVNASKLLVDNILLNGNEMHSIDSSGNIILTASGTGTVDFYANTTVHGNFHATGNVTLDGNIIFGDSSTDIITLFSDINSDVVPAINGTYTLGTSDNRWGDFETVLVNGQNLESNTLVLGDINPVLRHGNILFVAENGDDSNVGDHQNGPFASLSAALNDSRCVPGTTVYVYPGVYEEITPLVVPAGVSISGVSIRSCVIKPALSTIDNDVFLLHGGTIIENITISDFEYNVTNNTGYAFKFHPLYEAHPKSPYIRNVSVLTKGSTVRLETNSSDDPLGFDSGDAGRGAYLDGNVAVTGTLDHISCLFSSVTFITPNADSMTITNGCRIETVNCFHYYCNSAVDIITQSDGINGSGKTRLKIYGISSETVAAGDGIQLELQSNPGTYVTAIIESIEYNSPYTEIIIDGLVSGWETSSIPPDSQIQQNITFSPGGETATHIANADYKDFGGELRSINTAYVYGNYGITATGVGSLAYLINHNFSFVGSGKSKENEISELPSSEVRVSQINGGKVYYTAVDQSGSFSTGDFFTVDFNTGKTSISGIDLNALDVTSLTFQSGSDRTYVNASMIETGNIMLGRDTVSSFSGVINLASASGQIDVQTATQLSHNLSLTGNFSVGGKLTLGNNVIDVVKVYGKIDENILPTLTETYSLGSEQYQWLDIYTGKYINDDVELSGNTIKTLSSNSNLELNASGTGKILINDSALFEQELSVNSTLYTSNIGITGTIAHNGDTVLTGSMSQTGDWTISNQFTIYGNAQLDNILISNNTVASMVGDLVLLSSGTGTVTIDDSLTINQNLIINDTFELENLTTSSSVTIDVIESNSFIISDNFIRISNPNTDFQLIANGTGNIVLDRTSVTQDLTVSGNTYLTDVSMNNSTVIGDTLLTGDWSQIGTLSITGLFENNNDVSVDDILIHGNTIESVNADLIFVANGTGNVDINDSAIFGKSLVVDNFYNVSLNLTNKLTANKLNTSALVIEDNYISSTLLDSDLQLLASGSGKIVFDTTEITNNLDVSQTTNLNSLNVIGNIDIIGAVQHSGEKTQTGDFALAGSLTITDDATISNIFINGNSISSNNGDLVLLANGTGKILINDSLQILNNLYVDDINASTVEFSGLLTADAFILSDIYIADNYIQTTSLNTDLLLQASGTGNVVMDYFSIDNNFSNLDYAYFHNIGITGSLDQTGNFTLFGDIFQTGDLSVSDGMTVDSDFILEEILISGNAITTTTLNTDLELLASGSGIINFQENVFIVNDLDVIGDVSSNSLHVQNILSSDILNIDEFTINDNYIEVTDTDLILRSYGTGRIYLEDILIDSKISTTANINLVIDPVAGKSVIFDLDTAVQVPVGTTSNKNLALTGVSGDFRFNIDDNFFEGFSTASRGFGGVFSGNRRTYVIAEKDRHTNDNILTFTANSIQTMTIAEETVTTNGLLVDDNLLINGNTIATTQSNSDLEIVTTGYVYLDSTVKFQNETITNTTDSPFTLSSTGNGYFNFSTPTAMVVPAGPESERPDNPEVGDIRWNTETAYLEAFDGIQYNPASGIGDVVTAEVMDDLITLYALILG